MTRENLPAQLQDEAEETFAGYLAIVEATSVAEVQETPAPPAKQIQVKRRAKVGADIDSMVPEMSIEAKTRFRINSKEPVKAEEVVDKRGFCVLISDPTMMDVYVTFSVSRDDSRMRLDREYAALSAEQGEQKMLTGGGS